MDSNKWNIVLITSDEMRADAVGCLGNPDCRTPSIDALSEKGVLFTNHFTVHGKCVPSRIAMQTGRYCHTDGFRTIHLHMPVEQPHLLGKLKKLGYESAVFGHNHVWMEKNFWGIDNKPGTTYPDYHSYTNKIFAPLLEKQWGAEASDEDCSTRSDLLVEGYDYKGKITKPQTGFVDANRTEQAIHYLREVRDRDKPFYLHLNYGMPHPPYKCEEPFFSMYPREQICPTPYTLPENAPECMQRMRTVRTFNSTDESAFREIQSVYYGMISKVDRQIGRVVDEIEQQGLLDNTILVFTTDHGDFAGKYGLVEKWDTSMADCILHVPMIICAPGLPEGKRIDELSEHIDLPSTILDMLGSSTDWGVHGQSLVPVMNGAPGKDAVFADGGHEDEMWDRVNDSVEDAQKTGKRVSAKQQTYHQHPSSMARTKMVRTKEWKLVVRLTGGNELYNMQSDPDEMHNLWPEVDSKPELQQITTQLQMKLLEWCLRTDTDRPHEQTVGA